MAIASTNRNCSVSDASVERRVFAVSRGALLAYALAMSVALDVSSPATGSLKFQ